MNYQDFNAQRKRPEAVSWDVLEFDPEGFGLSSEPYEVTERELSDDERREFERLLREGRL